MRKVRNVAIAAAIAFAALWSGLSGAGSVAAGQLTVVGEGVASAAPDMATIRLGVSSEARTAAEALDAASAATGEMLTLLSEMGIEQEDMQTSNLSLNPVWSSRSSTGEDRIVGYQADNTVTVRVRALGDLGAILDDVVALGGANRFNGLSFGLIDPGPVEDEARRAAVADALRKAALYAQAAGLDLGAIMSISEAGASAPVASPMVEAVVGARAVSVAAGSLDVRANVTVVFDIGGD